MCTEAGWRHAGRAEVVRRAQPLAPRAQPMYPYAPVGSQPLQVGRHGQQGAHDLAPG